MWVLGGVRWSVRGVLSIIRSGFDSLLMRGRNVDSEKGHCAFQGLGILSLGNSTFLC
jgi:hypothetical protein